MEINISKCAVADEIYRLLRTPLLSLQTFPTRVIPRQRCYSTCTILCPLSPRLYPFLLLFTSFLFVFTLFTALSIYFTLILWAISFYSLSSSHLPHAIFYASSFISFVLQVLVYPRAIFSNSIHPVRFTFKTLWNCKLPLTERKRCFAVRGYLR